METNLKTNFLSITILAIVGGCFVWWIDGITSSTLSDDTQYHSNNTSQINTLEPNILEEGIVSNTSSGDTVTGNITTGDSISGDVQTGN